MPENIIIYDWVSITSKIHDPLDFMYLLGLQDVQWVPGTGAHGFPYAMYFDSIKLHFGRDDGFTWLEMTGQGCRAFETFGNGNYEALFELVLDNPDVMNITRLDVAYDDITGIIPMDELVSDTRTANFVSRFKSWKIEEGTAGKCVYHGSVHSEVLIRIYDKAAERGYEDGRHWIRVEIQLRRDRALGFIQLQGDIGKNFSGVLINYLRYVEPDGLDSNKWRWPIKEYWAAICENASKISLYQKPGTEYNIFCLTNYVFKQAGNAIDTAIQIFVYSFYAVQYSGLSDGSALVRLYEDKTGMQRNTACSFTITSNCQSVTDVYFGFRYFAGSTSYLLPFIACQYITTSGLTAYAFSTDSYPLSSPYNMENYAIPVSGDGVSAVSESLSYDLAYSTQLTQIIAALQTITDNLPISIPVDDPYNDLTKGGAETEDGIDESTDETKEESPSTYWYDILAALGITSLIDISDVGSSSVSLDEEDLDVPTLPDVTDKFPFCIPFDIVHTIQALNATSEAPCWTIPINIDSIGYSDSITIDLSGYESVAEVIRWFIVISFILSLALVTRDLIRG